MQSWIQHVLFLHLSFQVESSGQPCSFKCEALNQPLSSPTHAPTHPSLHPHFHTIHLPKSRSNISIIISAFPQTTCIRRQILIKILKILITLILMKIIFKYHIIILESSWCSSSIGSNGNGMLDHGSTPAPYNTLSVPKNPYCAIKAFLSRKMIVAFM